MLTEKESEKIKKLLDSAENSIFQAKNILNAFGIVAKSKAALSTSEEEDSIEGIFDGEKMVDKDMKPYLIPQNYASKSKLVTGDVLKLRIADSGDFIFKQIGPVKRKKLVGTLIEQSEGKFTVQCGSVHYHVLPASVTYFKAKPGDKLSIMIPEELPSEWAAVENLIDN